ncbi:MAG: hypothetical protein IKG52_07685 [Rhodobacteraceae bacterium]|nr:hypothetical protein [Paracoccaceae bacterium]
MRHLALLLAFLLTLSGLSYAHAHTAASFADKDTPPQTLGALLLEHVGRASAHLEAEPDPAGPDTAPCHCGAATTTPLANAAQLRAAARSGPVQQTATAGNPPRAPPLPI